MSPSYSVDRTTLWAGLGLNDGASNTTVRPEPNFIQEMNIGLYLIGLVSMGVALLTWMIACCTSKTQPHSSALLGNNSRRYRVQPNCTKCSCVSRPPYFLLFVFWAFAVALQAVSLFFFLFFSAAGVTSYMFYVFELLLTLFPMCCPCNDKLPAAHFLVYVHVCSLCCCSGICGNTITITLA